MISVIVPIYNSVKHLDLCIGSFLQNQTKLNEMIVVIDGLIETNKSIIEKYSKKSNIKFICLNNNVGMCRAQNIGATNASSNKILACSSL